MPSITDTKEGRLLPLPTTARQELPDAEALRRAEIELAVDEARVCLVVWSFLLADGNSKSRSTLYQALVTLAVAGSISFERDGLHEAAPHPELAGRPWPYASSLYRKFDIDHTDLAEYWRSAKNKADDACYPLEWTTAMFPAAIWPMLVTLLRWGPERAGIQLEETAAVMARTPIKRGNRRRPAGSLIAKSTIETRLGITTRLMKMAIAVRARVTTSPRPTLAVALLDTWTHLPVRPDLKALGAKPSGLDNGGPSLDDCRLRISALADDLHDNPEFPFMRSRRLLMLGLLALLGPRGDVIRIARSSDYARDRLWPDGVRRPTLTIRPGKSWDADGEHYLPLPLELAGWLESWLLLTAEKYGGGDRPLFPGRSRPGEPLPPLTYPGFYSAVAGRPNHGSGRQHALIPLNGDSYTGVRPHGFRKASSELAHRAAVILKTTHPGVYDHLTPEHFSRALLGHALTQSITDTYRSLDRERLTSLAAEISWTVLRGIPSDEETLQSRNDGALVDALAELGRLESQDVALAGIAVRVNAEAASEIQVERLRIATDLAACARKIATLARPSYAEDAA